MEHPTSAKRNAHVHEAACEWFVEFRTGKPGESARKAFLAWLQESPAHMGAYLEVTALWSDTAAVNRDRRWTIDELISQARREPQNVVTLAGVTQPPQKGDQRHRVRLWVVSIAASIALLALSAVVQWYMGRNTYDTDVGEQRSLTLADGSTVQLNARSKLHVTFTDRERRIDLIRGQALFRVAKNPARPFIVASGDTRVRAVGTQFDVYLKSSGTVVTVVEGKVAVFGERASASRAIAGERAIHTPLAPLPQPVYLSAGQQLTVVARSATETSAPAVPMSVNVSTATAWTQQELVFESTPLAEVAEEFNRYNPRQLIITDPALQTFRIDGVFSSTDPGSLLRFLRARAGVEVTETDSTIVLARKK